MGGLLNKNKKDKTIIKSLNNINLQIKSGDRIGLIGHNGSGKSSLLHMLALLDEPTQGKIIINNEETKNLKNIPVEK